MVLTVCWVLLQLLYKYHLIPMTMLLDTLIILTLQMRKLRHRKIE